MSLDDRRQLQRIDRKRKLGVENPNGIQILRWLSHIAGFRLLKMSPDKQSLKTAATLVETSVADLQDIYTAARFSNSLAYFLSMPETIASLEQDLGEQVDAAVPLNTGLSVGRKGVLFRYGTVIVLAFEATKPDEMIKNAWSHAKDSKWSLPYARYVDGRQVHSFYLDMWLGMRPTALAAIAESVLEMERRTQVPSRILVTGHSMGGGISTLAIMDIVEHLRNTFGSQSTDARSWATDDRLGALLRHVTFAEFGASGKEYNLYLNAFYERYTIPAWDFVHPHDFTSRLHLPFLRAPRGHRYVLPDAAVRPFEREYAAGRHDMPGYMKSMEWLRENPRKLRSMYQYGRVG